MAAFLLLLLFVVPFALLSGAAELSTHAVGAVVSCMKKLSPPLSKLLGWVQQQILGALLLGERHASLLLRCWLTLKKRCVWGRAVAS